MYCLFFDIASHQKVVALVEDDQVLSVEVTDDPVGDQELIPLVEAVLADASQTFEDLDRIACIVGPGGFTSLRIAVAFANTLADQLAIPSAGVHLSDWLHAQCKEEDVVWIHATKKDEVFVRGFGAHQNLWLEPAHITIDQLLDELPEGTTWCGELLDAQQEKLAKKRIQLASMQLIDEVLPPFLTQVSFDTNILVPWYGRGW